jgi:hypothetical protein
LLRRRREILAAAKKIGLADAVPRIGSLDEGTFRRLGAEGKPYVVAGFARGWPLADLTPEALLERFGALEGRARLGDYVKSAFTKRRTWARMSLSQYLGRDPGPPGSLPAYLGNQAMPELTALCEWPSFFASDVPPKIWLGPAGTVTPLHCDYDDNLFAQLWGKKRFRLYPPHHDAFLYTRQANPALHASRFDPEAPDFEAMPLAREAVGIECEVEAGDLLYLPAGWFHHVRSLTLSLSANRWSHGPVMAMGLSRSREGDRGGTSRAR